MVVSALQCEFRKDPVLGVRNRAHTWFFIPSSWAILLETALETAAPLAGVLLFQVPGSDISALQQSVQVLCVSSTQQELPVVGEA